MYTLLSLQEPDKHWRVYHDFCVCFGVFYGIFFIPLLFWGGDWCGKMQLQCGGEGAHLCDMRSARARCPLPNYPRCWSSSSRFLRGIFFYQREEFTQHRALNFMGLLWRWALHSMYTQATRRFFSPTEIKCIYYHFPHLISPRPFTKAPSSIEKILKIHLIYTKYQNYQAF